MPTGPRAGDLDGQDGTDKFDEYVLEVTVRDSFLTIEPDPSSVECKICFVEISARVLEPASVATTTVFEASYDYRTRRISKMENGETTTFRYDGGVSYQEYTAGSKSAEFVRGSGMGGGIGSILYSERPGDREYFIYCPAVGHVTATVTGDAPFGAVAVKSTNLYESFGGVVMTSGSSDNNRLANTKERDASLGLDCHGFRYYDPEIGRYCTRDPIGYASGTMSIYEYVGSNPVNGMDPLGLGPYIPSDEELDEDPNDADPEDDETDMNQGDIDVSVVDRPAPEPDNESKPRVMVVAIQGFISSPLALGSMAQQLRIKLLARGMEPDVFVGAGWRWSQGKLEKVIKSFIRKTTEMGADYKLVLVGHSRGAGRAIKIADALSRENIPVSALALLDQNRTNWITLSYRSVRRGIANEIYNTYSTKWNVLEVATLGLVQTEGTAIRWSGKRFQGNTRIVNEPRPDIGHTEFGEDAQVLDQIVKLIRRARVYKTYGKHTGPILSRWLPPDE